MTLCIMLMLLWARSQRSFEFTRILMNDLRKNCMFEDVKTTLQAEVRWSDPRIKHETVSINIHAIMVTMEKVKKFIEQADWKMVVIELIKLCLPRAVKGVDQPYIFDSGAEEKISLLLTPMGQSLTYLAKQGKKAKPKEGKEPAKPKKPRGAKQPSISMPSEAMSSLVDAEGIKREITWIEDVLAMADSVLAPLDPAQIQQEAKKDTISKALEFMGMGILKWGSHGSQETTTHKSYHKLVQLFMFKGVLVYKQVGVSLAPAQLHHMTLTICLCILLSGV